MGIGRIRRREFGLAQVRQQLEAAGQGQFVFKLAAIVLHDTGDGDIDLLPADAALGLFQWGIGPGNGIFDLRSTDWPLTNCSGIGGRHATRITPGGVGFSVTSPSEQRRPTRGIEAVQRRLQLPVDQKAAPSQRTYGRRCVNSGGPEIGMDIPGRRQDRCLEHILFRVKTGLGEGMINGDAGFAFIADHHPENHPSFQGGQAGQVGIERQGELSAADAFGQIAGQLGGPVLIQVNPYANTITQHELLTVGGGAEALADVGQHLAVHIHPGDLFAIGVHDRGAVERIVRTTHAVGGVAKAAEASRARLLHADEFGAGLPADGLAHAGAVQVPHGAAGRKLRCETE